jgi:hypothetical protein
MSLHDHLANLNIPLTNLRPLLPENDRIHLIDVPGQQAIDHWKKLSNASNDTGYSPIILGPPHAVPEINDRMGIADDHAPDAILEASLKVDPEKWFAKQRELDPELYGMEESSWPDDVPPNDSITSIADILTQKIHPSITLALVPTPASWEAPAYLRFGGWNECPQPFEQVAIWRRWNYLYGAEICAITSDVVEAFVAKPPADRDAALKLACEQFNYCTDIVLQGTQSLEALAAGLLNGKTWYFWWD